MTKRIVAEISKTWPSQTRVEDQHVLALRFEQVIERNGDRGYELDSWQFQSVSTLGGELVETIIAVFIKTHGNTNQP